MTDELLLNCSADELIARAREEIAAGTWPAPALLHFDPPWAYELHGMGKGPDVHYTLSPLDQIAATVAAAYDVAAESAYLALWVTFPKLREWYDLDLRGQVGGWRYATGAAWGKQNGFGQGIHFRGDAELCLVYVKGHPLPYEGSRTNFWLSGQDPGGLWIARRAVHSEKPQAALAGLCRLIPPGALILDPYAGETASMWQAADATQRAYRGSELDPGRWAKALARHGQGSLLSASYGLPGGAQTTFADVPPRSPLGYPGGRLTYQKQEE